MANVLDDKGLDESRLPLLNEQSKNNVASIFCSRNPISLVPTDEPIDDCSLELKTCTKQTFTRKYKTFFFELI